MSDHPPERHAASILTRNAWWIVAAFAVIYGDSYLPCDYAAVLAAFRDSGKPGLMSVYRNRGLWDTSNVEFAGGRILAYDKANRSPAMQHIDYGLGVFQRTAFEGVPDDRPSDLAALYQDLLRRGQLAAWESPGRFYEIEIGRAHV